MNDSTSARPNDGDDALLDRATEALRSAPIPDGPSPELTARTLAAVREAHSRDLRSMRLRPFHAAVRIAAGVALLASVVGVYLVATRDTTTTVVAPTPVTPTDVAVAGTGASPKSPQTQPQPGALAQGSDPNPAPATQGTPAANDHVVVAAAVPPPIGIGGTVLFVGAPPSPVRIDMSAVAECRDRHPQGAFDDSVIVAGGRLANVVISIEPVAGQGQDLVEMASASSFEERAPLVLDQRDCQFHPRVLAGMVGQELVVRNSDPFLHNVHSKANANPKFNIGQPTVEFGRRLEPLAAPERFQIKCDLHPWMAAAVSVFEHPYFTVSAPDGSFTIATSGLADGAYTLLAWHETLGARRALVEVRDGHATTMTEFKFSQGMAGDGPTRAAAVQLCANCKK